VWGQLLLAGSHDWTALIITNKGVCDVCVRMADSWVCRISKRPCLAAESPASATVGGGAECENCERATAAVACQQCECNFCSACAEHIHASKAMKKHSLAAISEGAAPNIGSVASNTPHPAQVAQPQSQSQPPPALDGFGMRLQAVRCAVQQLKVPPLHETVL
jgi:hypothetical protein